MFKGASQSQQYIERTGSFADVPSRRGGGSGEMDTALLASLGEQMDCLRKVHDELPEGEQKLAIRHQLLNFVNRVREASHLRFQDHFLYVCERRLPKNTFLSLVQDARRIWEGEGCDKIIPLDLVEDAKKLQKREKKKRYRAR